MCLWLDFSVTSPRLQLPTKHCSIGYWHHGLHVVWRAVNFNCISLFECGICKNSHMMAGRFSLGHSCGTFSFFHMLTIAHTTWSFNGANVWPAFGCDPLPIPPTFILTKYFLVIGFLNWLMTRNTFVLCIYYEHFFIVMVVAWYINFETFSVNLLCT
jgi:hypothetical protein